MSSPSIPTPASRKTCCHDAAVPSAGSLRDRSLACSDVSRSGHAPLSDSISGVRAPRAATADDPVFSLTQAALAFGRLDRRLGAHPLLPAILFRERLEAARACAAVDGHLIDPWSLGAELEGLTPRILGESAYERGTMVDALHAAFDQYLWLARPDGDRAPRIADAMVVLRRETQAAGPLLGAARAFHRWIDAGMDRAAMRGALVCFWRTDRVLCAPLPLVGAGAFASDVPWAPARWHSCFLSCLADDANAMERRIAMLEHAWRAARAAAPGQRRTSHAGAAIDLIAAFPVISASRLSHLLGMSLKAAYLHLERFLDDGLVIEVTHRSARRLFALNGLAPLREAVQPPRRPMPGRKRGRPRRDADFPETRASLADASDGMLRAEDAVRTLTPVDYTDLEEAMAAADAAIARFQRRSS